MSVLRLPTRLGWYFDMSLAPVFPVLIWSLKLDGFVGRFGGYFLVFHLVVRLHRQGWLTVDSYGDISVMIRRITL